VLVTRRRDSIPLAHAFDEARFGPARTLDLRAGLPTVAEAVRRAEPWLRERQMARAGEVLIITGRGHGSPGGIAAIKPAVDTLLARLTRAGVVARVRAHTPGSVAVELAPIQALFATRRRARHRDEEVEPTMPEGLDALDAETREELQLLATYSLSQLGVPATPEFVRDEMLRQFSILVRGMRADEPERERRLRFLISAARAAFEDNA
jgi:hypothetical protein